jgi:hypothetical protein
LIFVARRVGDRYHSVFSGARRSAKKLLFDFGFG